ncbi:MAG TPA: tripartite tricarboxylate transporter TctB family protein [bacterium]|nr:tripartite tricarboxylate transporter TctB family protein [bacterium]
MRSPREPAAPAAPRRGGSDRLAAVVIFIVAGLYVRYALSFQPPRFRSEALGPATFPLLIGTLMLICSTLLFVQASRAPARRRAGWRLYLQPFALWTALALYVLIFAGAGFLPSTAAFLLAALAVLGVRPWWKTALYAALFTAALYVAFTALEVRLPAGEWFRR